MSKFLNYDFNWCFVYLNQHILTNPIFISFQHYMTDTEDKDHSCCFRLASIPALSFCQILTVLRCLLKQICWIEDEREWVWEAGSAYLSELSDLSRIHRAVLALEQVSREQGQFHPAGPAKWQMTVTMRTSWKLIVMAEHKGREPESSSAVEAAQYPVISAGRPLCSHTPRHTLITALHAQLERRTQGGSVVVACDYLYSLLHLKKEKEFCCHLR